jgi:hypothetical protein
MSTRSDVGIACKPKIQEQIDILFPWIKEAADDMTFNDEGTLYHITDIKWYEMDGGDVERFYKWLKTQNHDDFIVVEACHDYPSTESSSGDLGSWTENPWNVRKAVHVSIKFNEI